MKKVAITVGLLSTVALSFVGAWVDFIPADGLHGAPALWVFGFLGLMLSVGLLVRVISAGRARIPKGREGIGAAFGLLMLPILIGGMLWLDCVKALPWAYARVLGQPVEIRATMHLEHRYSRKSCSNKLKGGPMAATLPDYICVSQGYYDAHPNKDVVVRLSGRQTLLGVAIIDVIHVEEAH